MVGPAQKVYRTLRQIDAFFELKDVFVNSYELADVIVLGMNSSSLARRTVACVVVLGLHAQERNRYLASFSSAVMLER